MAQDLCDNKNSRNLRFVSDAPSHSCEWPSDGNPGVKVRIPPPTKAS